MEIVAACYTDAGIIREINQDSLSVKVVNSSKGKIAFAIVCDGMGGLEHGELASREVVMAFNNWFGVQCAQMVAGDSFTLENICGKWRSLIEGMNEGIAEYAEKNDMVMGTTVSALLVYQGKFIICHVGDSRIYQIAQGVKQLTADQTLVEQEVRLGILTREEARTDRRRNILLQCVGASNVVKPQFEAGRITEDTVFLLATDGFVHMVSEEELYAVFSPSKGWKKEELMTECGRMVKLVMDRGERDNVTLVALAIYK
ncbi:MAG: protein phosphatase 2C domain-containing protein [Lachnospiraceae bacterium]|nr:protein phosphatase 2C domain-containing protein [Lachnospiraceae bacterium]